VSDIEFGGPWLLILGAAIYLLLAIPGAVPLAWILAYRVRGAHVLAAVAGGIVGGLAVAVGFWAAAKLARRLFPVPSPVPVGFWVLAYLPAWLLAVLAYLWRRGSR
jgi:hypothetical protein